jgi:hypothetical protein
VDIFCSNDVQYDVYECVCRAATANVCLFVFSCSQIYVPLDFESRYVVSRTIRHFETDMGCAIILQKLCLLVLSTCVMCFI